MDYTGLPTYTDETGRVYYVLPDGVTLVPVPTDGSSVKFTPPFVPPKQDTPITIVGSLDPESMRLIAEQERNRKLLPIAAVVLLGAFVLLR